MREIEFRALGVSSGDYHYGYGYTDSLNVYPEKKRQFWIWSNYRWVEIDIKTLGQYAGLKDKNGVKIFDGDIVKATFWDCYSNGCACFDDGSVVSGKVCFDKGGWFITESEGCWLFLFDCDESFGVEVIGNIHQNANLLSEKV